MIRSTEISAEQIKKLQVRLGYAINQTVRNYILGANRATPELVVDLIDMKKLHQGEFADILSDLGDKVYAEIITGALAIASKTSSQPLN